MSLSSTTLNTFLHTRSAPRPPYSASGDSRSDMSSAFNRLKKTLSRRSSNPPEEQTKASASSTQSSSFTSRWTPTRRPSNTNVANPSLPSDPPPAYSTKPTSPYSSSQSAAATHVIPSDDDPYAILSSYDTVFVIDDSSSMLGRCWQETEEALRLITPICTAHDADGIDIYFLNTLDSDHFKNVKNAATVTEIFQTVRPRGYTPTGRTLERILLPYVKSYERNPERTKPINVIVITDGAPSDCVESALTKVAKKLDKLEAPAWQVGVQFFQVGNDPSAREHLKRLDDDLKEFSGDEEMRDMVDTVAFQGDGGTPLTHTGVLKVVCGSFIRRLDRRSKDLYRA